MLKRLCGTLAVCLSYLCAYSNSVYTSTHTHIFIEWQSEIAVQEMHRTSIPASITLAQSIIESSWGNGELATNANNYFGIKCKSTWTGDFYKLKDDDYENGKLVASCFRAYPSIEDSFIDHSNFLMENQRYSFLFQLKSDDYVAWAKGLKAAGYATDPQYAEKLIAKIEQYQLYKYDRTSTPYPILVQTNHQLNSSTIVLATDSSRIKENEGSVAPKPATFVLPADYRPHYYSQSVAGPTTRSSEKDLWAARAALVSEVKYVHEPMPAYSTEANRALAPRKPKKKNDNAY